MEIIGRVSRGSKMDQVYISKNRPGLNTGDYVIVKSLEEEKSIDKLYFYGVRDIEPIKLELIKEIIRIVTKEANNYDNIIITGSFLDRGFQFNDIDILFLAKGGRNIASIKKEIEKKTGIKAHIIAIDNKSFLKGLEKDPLYQVMLSRCVAKSRFVYKAGHKINYKLLDLHLLKSKILVENFDNLNGDEKYNLVRNMMAISMYLDKKRVRIELLNREIKKKFRLRDIDEIKKNIINKKSFLKRYKLIYQKTFSKILQGIKNGSKQK